MNLKKNDPKYKTVMLVDDSEIDNIINEMMIKGSGFSEHVYKHNGALGSLEFLKNLEMLKDASAELLPSVIFLDINMPVLDGFQFLDEFNNLPMFIKKIKIVILSSSANPTDKKMANKYKVFKFLQKPLTEEGLKSLN